MALSRQELAELTTASIDPQPWGKLVRREMNKGLTDEELVAKIKKCNNYAETTALLRYEYRRRLEERCL